MLPSENSLTRTGFVFLLKRSLYQITRPLSSKEVKCMPCIYQLSTESFEKTSICQNLHPQNKVRKILMMMQAPLWTKTCINPTQKQVKTAATCSWLLCFQKTLITTHFSNKTFNSFYHIPSSPPQIFLFQKYLCCNHFYLNTINQLIMWY